jgi:molybdopterin/thiamine biosynthesis adenylyltransferase
MEKYFNRQIKLWGLETQQSLQAKHIVIVGCGGLGCSLGIALGSSGIGKITLIDFDEVGVHNIHRQIGFRVGDEGQKKCEVLKNLIMSRCQFVEVESIDGSFDDFVSLNKSLKVDLILDATDNLPTRAKIDNYAKSKNIPWIYGSVEEFHGQVCFFDKASFESVFNVKERIPNGIACPIVMQIGSFQANLALKYLAGFAIKKDFLYYVFFNNDGEFTLQKFNLPI